MRPYQVLGYHKCYDVLFKVPLSGDGLNEKWINVSKVKSVIITNEGRQFAVNAAGSCFNYPSSVLT